MQHAAGEATDQSMLIEKLMGDVPSNEGPRAIKGASMLAESDTITPLEIMANREDSGVTNLVDFEYGSSLLLSSESDSALESATVPALLILRLTLRMD